MAWVDLRGGAVDTFSEWTFALNYVIHVTCNVLALISSIYCSLKFVFGKRKCVSGCHKMKERIGRYTYVTEAGSSSV